MSKETKAGLVKVQQTVPRFTAWLLTTVCMWLLSSCTTQAPVPASSGVPTPASPALAATAAPGTGVSGIPAGWRSYTDTALGYSLSFPEDVEFTSGTNKAGIYTARLQFSVAGADGYQGMVLRVEPNPERRGVEQVVEEIYRRNLLSDPPVNWLQELGSVTVGGLSGVQLGQGGDFSLVVPYEDHVYMIAPVHGEATTELDPRALALFYQILATLRIAP